MGQMSMFSEAQKISMPEVPDVSEEESLKKEREMLGIYIHGHPSQKLLSYVGKLRHCVPVDELPTCAERGTVGTIGMISNCEPRLTRSREKDLMHPQTKKELEYLLTFLKDQGEKMTFRYLRNQILKGEPFPWEEKE
jgi:DNA polymerase III alpha subunit